MASGDSKQFDLAEFDRKREQEKKEMEMLEEVRKFALKSLLTYRSGWCVCCHRLLNPKEGFYYQWVPSQKWYDVYHYQCTGIGKEFYTKVDPLV